MAIVACRECGKEISTEAAMCPHCGAPARQVTAPATPVTPQPKKKRMHWFFRLVLWIIIIPIVVLILVGMFGSGKTSAPAAPADATPGVEQTPPQPPPPPSIRVTATQLFEDYSANEVAADEKYKGKRIDVSGAVASINKDFTNDIWLGLVTPNQFMPVHATGFSAAQVVKLAKGQGVMLTCTGAGMMVGAPILKDCQ